VARSDGYVGIDRRQPVSTRSYPIVQARLFSAAGSAVVLWCVLVAFAARFWPGLELQLANDARGCAGAVFLCGGAMRMARWRLTGEAAVGFWAAALVVLGGCWTMLGFLGPDLQPGARLSDAPAATVVIAAPVFGLLVAGLCTPPVRASLRPVMLAAGCIAGCTAVLVAVAAGRPANAAGLYAPTVWTGLECVVAVGWATIGICAWRRASAAGRPTGRWAAGALYLMAIGAGLRAVSLLVAGSLFAAANGLQLVAASVALTAAAVELCEAYAAQGVRALLLSSGLDQAYRQLRMLKQDHLERLHDARSAVVGVIGASHLLSSVTGDDAVAGLQAMMAAELNRLNQVLDPEVVDPLEQFWLDEALEAVLLGHRLAGWPVQTESLHLPVLGRRRVTATVIANLLANVRMHAPGATARLSAQCSDGVVTTLVDDDGPGIPLSQRLRVLQRSERGPQVRAPGSGLGLYTASVAMAKQDGALSLDESPAGGLRVMLSLPEPAAGWTDRESAGPELLASQAS
jgi:signal transduction histidine kinase